MVEVLIKYQIKEFSYNEIQVSVIKIATERQSRWYITSQSKNKDALNEKDIAKYCYQNMKNINFFIDHLCRQINKVVNTKKNQLENEEKLYNESMSAIETSTQDLENLLNIELPEQLKKYS